MSEENEIITPKENSEEVDVVDEQVIEDLYGKEHINLVFIGHVG